MLKKKGNKKTKTIVSIDSYMQSSYALKDTSMIPQQKLALKSDSFFVTYLANKDMITAPLEIGSGIADEELAGVIENMAYDELGLDSTIEYIIRYIEGAHSDTSRIFHLFVIEKEKYAAIFENLRSQVKYIDLIVPAPLLYKSLYDLELVDPKGTQCYIYFTQYDTFVTFYKDGMYLYSKSINYSFEEIYEYYCEMVGETVDKDIFFDNLKRKGMKDTDAQSDYQRNIMDLFGKIFIAINDIVVYVKRAYKLEIINHVFVGSSLGSFSGLDLFVQNYLGLHSSNIEFDFQMEVAGKPIDQLQLMMTVVGLEYMSRYDRSIVNFTEYPRPPAFFKRPSGQFVWATLAVIALALLPPTYYYVILKANEAREDILKKEERKLNIEASKYRKILAKKRKEAEGLEKKISNEKKVFKAKEKTFFTVYKKKVHYRLRSNQVVLLARDLLRYDVRARDIKFYYDEQTKSNKYYISLASDSDTKITKLIKGISEEYDRNISSIDIDLIQKEQNSTLYQGILRVGVE